MRRRYLMLSIVLVAGLVIGFLYWSGGKEEAFYQTVQEQELTAEEQKWVESIQENGVYLYKPTSCMDGEGCKYLLYSKKKLMYDYREAHVEQTEDVVTISLRDILAGDEARAQNELFVRIHSDNTPKEIELYVNEQQSGFGEAL